MKKFIAIALFFLFAVTLMITAAKCQTYYGANFVNYEAYTDSISNDWLLQCYSSGDTMSFRLRMESAKGFKSVQPYISFKNQAAEKGITVKFMVCIDYATLPATNLANITALKNAGCYVPDVELFNEFYSNDPQHTKGTCEFDFACYKSKFLPQINAIKAAYPNTRFFFCLAPRPLNSSINGGRSDHQKWNDSIKNYIKDNPLYNVTYHLYFNAKDCPILADTLTPQIISTSYNSYLDTYYSTLRTQLFSSALLQQVTDYLNLNFAGKKIAMTEIGIIGGDPDKGSTSNIRNTFVYSEWLYYLLQNIQAYEVDIHSGIALTGIIQPTSKFDLVDGLKNKRRMEYYSLFLNKNLTAKAGVCYQPLFIDPILEGYNASVIGYEYVSSPYYYSSLGATAFFKTGSVKSYEIPLKTDPFISGHVFGYQIVNFTPACRDTSYYVNDTSYTTIQVANPIPVKCSRFFYSLFHGKECTVTYHDEQQMILTPKLKTETICD